MVLDKILRTTEIQLAGVPCLYFSPNFVDGDIPTVLFYHGWHSSKDDNRFLASILAVNGYRVIVPDSIHHGERDSIDYDAEGMLKQYFWSIILNSVKESTSLLRDASDKLSINLDRIAVAGSSMGGFIASGVFALNKNIKSLICINGASAWEWAEELFRKYDGHGLADDKQLEYIRRYDPIGNKDLLYPRPILILHGDRDTQIPVRIQRYFYKEMKKVYKSKPERIKMVEIHGINHQKTVGMVEEFVNWLDKYMFE